MRKPRSVAARPACAVGRQVADHAGHGGDAQAQGVDGFEHRLLVLLHVLEIGQRQALHHDQQAARAPITRPVLARTSSAASGFRFCGMIEEPVVKASVSLDEAELRRRPQITISSARRDRWTAQIAAAARYSSAKSRSDTASRLLAVGRSKPSAAPSRGGRSGSDVPASAAAPSGHSFIRAGASRSGRGRAEHLHIGQQVVAEGHRLGRCRWVKPGITVSACASARSSSARLQVGELGGRRRSVAHPEAEVDRHLVVARARGVQPPGWLADQLGQPRLDVHVDVFQALGLEREAARLNPPGLCGRALKDLVGLVRGFDDPRWASMAAWALRLRDVLDRQTLIEADRDVDAFHDRGRATGETPTPELVGGFPRSEPGFRTALVDLSASFAAVLWDAV